VLCVGPYIYCYEITATCRCLKLTCVESYISNIIAILSKIFGEIPLILSESCAFISGEFSLFYITFTEREAKR
jgi:hypothetical protein